MQNKPNDKGEKQVSFKEFDNLDNIDLIKKLDRSGIYSYLCSISEHSYESYKEAKITFSFPNHDIKNIVGAGMGGSGMAPLVISSLFRDELKVPYIVSQDYNIPDFVNSNTLFIAISDSGETEETISQYNQANKKKAEIIVIGQGKKLIELAKKDNKRYYIYSTKVPARISFAFVFGPSIACLENIGVVLEDKEEGLKEAIEIVNELNSEIGVNVRTEKNIAKQIAIKLKTRIPILYIEPPFDSLGPRFTKMFSENARMFAFYNRFPEVRHNEIMTWASSSEFRLNFVPILLRDNKNNSRMETEIDIVKELLDSKVKEVIEFRAEGKSKIARFFYLLHLTDMITFYEAILVKKDPSETPELKELKKRLRASTDYNTFSATV
jgi:glucose/mannose-6-phosphate isomerase